MGLHNPLDINRCTEKVLEFLVDRIGEMFSIALQIYFELKNLDSFEFLFKYKHNS